MTMEPASPAIETPLSAADLESDRKLEVLLDDMVASSPTLSPAFAACVFNARPFAPWEVRRLSSWKVPLLVAGGLLSVSLAVFLAPLGQLTPGTAIEVWGKLVAAALSAPASAVLSAGPVLAAAAESLRSAVSPGAALAVLATGAAFGAATVAVLRRRPVPVPH
jgi:hypothetical protein